MPLDSNPPVYFDCHICGECCSSWSIPIEKHKAEQLLEKDWVKNRLSQTRRMLQPVSAEMFRVPLTDENVCVFLAGDKRCLIEVHEGLTLKPLECQKFPFASVKLPDGEVRQDTSAACKHISETLLKAFQPILPRENQEKDSIEALQALEMTQFEDVEALPSNVYVGLWQKIEWLHWHLSWNTNLKRIFEHSDVPSSVLLFQVYQYLKGEERPQAQRNTSWWLESLAVVFFLRKPYGSWSWMNFINGKRYHDPRLFGLEVDLTRLKHVEWNNDCNLYLNAFLFNLLGRKRLLARKSSLEGLLALAWVASFLVKWYSRALAMFKDEAQVELSDVTTAIRLVERYYTGHQPRFLHFFQSRLRGKLVSLLFSW